MSKGSCLLLQPFDVPLFFVRGGRVVEQASFALPGHVKEQTHRWQSGSKLHALQKVVR